MLEDLNHRDTADIFGSGLGHPVLGGLILCHDLGIFAAHHGEHGRHRDDGSQQAGNSHPPVEHKHQNYHSDKQDNRSYDICQVMGQQRFRIRCCRVQSSADQSRSVGVEITKRRLHHMGDALFADIGCRTKSCQMCTH